jgi:hypothetical protein
MVRNRKANNEQEQETEKGNRATARRIRIGLPPYQRCGLNFVKHTMVDLDFGLLADDIIF